MQIHPMPSDPVPMHRRIVLQITDALACRRLRCGEKLASRWELTARAHLLGAPLPALQSVLAEVRGELQSERDGSGGDSGRLSSCGGGKAHSLPAARPSASRHGRSRRR